MDRTLYTPLDAAEINELNLIGAAIYGPDDVRIGSVAHVHGLGPTVQVIVDVGGFLGIGTRPVSIAASQLAFMRDDDDQVFATTSWTKDQVNALPEHHH